MSVQVREGLGLVSISGALAQLRELRVMSDEEAAAHAAAEDAKVRAKALAPTAIDRWLKVSGVGARQRQENIRQELIPEAMVRWASGFPRSLSGASALLAGTPGGGKTCTAVWLMIELYCRSHIDEEGVWSVPTAAFVSATELFAMCFERRRETTRLGELEKVALLVIDDWGAGYDHPWPLAQLDRLIDRRWNELLSTVVTTNLVPEAKAVPSKVGGKRAAPPQDTFARRYPRIHSRLCDRGGPGIVPILRGDLRRDG